ncbi:hypothetical protein [Thermoleptolyngbya sp. M55_K2018_002]|uniref:hypothetical protein n=1 Tax=Thermoleptolyngbya sp. M55_K2018_002 TaxID=2747808 RepID=UPI0019FA65F2|nr:hypothetical protein [Thermoleptolyngbya sp. M55_K2018_002]HIK40401.1 hypothetical protein [Thermoleptolyngbya sp. M55_K2018_002]
MPEEILPIAALQFDPRNARKRTERSSYMIRTSLEKFGPMRSLVGQRLPDGRIIVRAGNGTLEEAGQVGIDKVRVVERRPDELVVVVANDLDERQWAQYAIADNRASELSDWDEPVLEELHDEYDLGDWFIESEIEDWSEPPPDDDDEPAGSGVDGDRYVLPIVLNHRENQIWQAVKRGYGLKDDKKVFLKLLEGMELQ